MSRIGRTQNPPSSRQCAPIQASTRSAHESMSCTGNRHIRIARSLIYYPAPETTPSLLSEHRGEFGRRSVPLNFPYWGWNENLVALYQEARARCIPGRDRWTRRVIQFWSSRNKVAKLSPNSHQSFLGTKIQNLVHFGSQEKREKETILLLAYDSSSS